jgi:hypothetical protein
MDYTQRRVKLRIFVALTLLMGSLAAFERAGDRRTWALVGLLDEQQAPADREFDARLPRRPNPAERPDSFIAVSAVTEPAPAPAADDGLLAAIDDDTLFLRPAERECWLWLEDRLRTTDPISLRSDSIADVGYRRLHEQPHEYRGKIVTIRGTAKWAYRSAADKNGGEVTKRFVLWIMPEGGPPSPIVVFTLGVPPGFPTITASAGERMTRLSEEISVTGLFVKRGAYQAQDGARTAPVIIAGNVDWKGPAAILQRASRFDFGVGGLLPASAAALALAVVVFGLCYWLTVRSERQGRANSGQPAIQPDFRGLQAGPSAAEALRQMEIAHQRGQP